MNLTDLPPEVLRACFSFLKGPDLARIAQTCRQLNILVDSTSLWRDICLKEYCLNDVEPWGCSFREIYSKVLHKYGCLLGLWRNTTICYGGLVHIWYDAGKILARDYYGCEDIRKKLESKQLFHIKLVDGQVVLTVESLYGPFPCQLNLENIEDAEGSRFTMKWSLEGKKIDLQTKQMARQKFGEECDTRGVDIHFQDSKFVTCLETQYLQEFSSLHLQQLSSEDSRQVPLPPGLFKGTYSAHGTEIIQLRYNIENQRAFGTKITGDSNVPAGVNSIEVNLDEPMYLPREQQESLRGLAEINPDQFNIPIDGQTTQPFIVPVNVHDFVEHPKYCKFRYHCKGTVSPTGFTAPSKVHNHFIVFDDDTFGVLWIDLYSFSLFSRVKETFSTLKNDSLAEDFSKLSS